ncbi:MAG: helicase-related protein, partial [Saprospiraceae bacterium]
WIYHVSKSDKNNLLLELLKDSSIESALVFTRTKHGADKVVKFLVGKGVGAEAIHGNKAQNARQRALNNFKSRVTRVLVATDIAARGIDVDDLACVINLDIPNIPETYVHRIGRTGRAGASGVAHSFCEVEERPWLRDIEKLIGKKVPVVTDHPYALAFAQDPAPAPAKPAPPARSRSRRRRSGSGKSANQAKSV